MASELVIHPSVVLGPRIMRAGLPVHAVRHRADDKYYQVGEREYHVIEGLTRGAGRAEISESYGRRFGKPLGKEAWEQLEALFRSYNLVLDDTLPPSAPPTREFAGHRVGLMQGKLKLFDPSRLIDGMVGSAPWMVSKVALTGGLGCFVGIVLVTLLNLRAIQAEATRALMSQPLVILLVGLLLLITMFVHEMGHAICCVALGGECHEIGFAWRLPMIYFYAQVDDVYLLAARHRVLVAAAGILAGSVVLAPIVVAYVVVPPGTGRDVVAALQYMGFFATVVNLVPLFGMDGQRIVSHSVGIWDISTEGRHWLRQSISKEPRHKTFATSAKVFAVFELGVMTAMTIGGTWWWAAFLEPRLGPGRTVAIVLAAWLLTASVGLFIVQRRARRRI